MTVVVCERYSGELTCDDGAINICTAVYGRTHPTTCAHSSKTDCILDVSSFYIESCNGQTQCDVEASNSFGDPCSGHEKYLEITYSCEGNVRSPTPMSAIRKNICHHAKFTVQNLRMSVVVVVVMITIVHEFGIGHGY